MFSGLKCTDIIWRTLRTQTLRPYQCMHQTTPAIPATLARSRRNMWRKPKKLPLLKQRFLSWHELLNHFPQKDIFQIFDQSILPSEFAQLKADIPLCASCIYGKAHRKAWSTCGKKLNIRRDTENAPVKGTSTDKLVSDEPGLFNHIGGNLTAAII